MSETSVSESYKTFKLPLPPSQYDRQYNGEELEQLFCRFNSQFDKRDIYLSINGESCEINLRELSINHLESVINALMEECHPSNSSLLESIKQTINNVGSYGLRGNKRQYVGFNKERKVAGRKQKEQQRGKHYYTEGAEFEKSNQPLPKHYANKIICGDSEMALKSIPNNSVDLVFTSPPYNFGLAYRGQSDAAMWNDYFNKLFSIFDECIRVLKFGGRLVINVQPLFSDYIPSHHIISNHLISRRLIWRGEILWEKNNYNCKYTAWGSWKSPSNPYMKYSWEFLEVFCKGSLQHSGNKELADIDGDDFKKWVYGKWSIAPERKMKEYGHPAMFPEELARRVLLLFSFSGDVVLDPFMGVGTTCLSAKKHGRIYLGIDNSQQYCEVAEKRLASSTTNTYLE